VLLAAQILEVVAMADGRDDEAGVGQGYGGVVVAVGFADSLLRRLRLNHRLHPDCHYSQPRWRRHHVYSCNVYGGKRHLTYSES
jgi:hypothetical protein